MQQRKNILEELTTVYSVLESIGRDLAGEHYKAAYNFKEEIRPETFAAWMRDLRDMQRRIEWVLGQIEKGDME